MELTPDNLGGCSGRENGGVRELRGEFTCSRTKSRPVWLGEGGRRSWGEAGARGCRALKSMEGFRRRHWVPKEGWSNFDFTNSFPSVGWRTGWIGAKVGGQWWDHVPMREGSLEQGGCTGDGESHEEIWGVCWKLNVGGKKEEKIIQWWHSLSVSAKPFALNTSLRFCLWMSLTTDITSGSRPNLRGGTCQSEQELS